MSRGGTGFRTPRDGGEWAVSTPGWTDHRRELGLGEQVEAEGSGE